jgi:hypothetical protein
VRALAAVKTESVDSGQTDQGDEMAEDEQDLTRYADKPPTAMHEAFIEWLLDETGYDPNSAKSKGEAFAKGVALGAYLRPTYQKSDANHDRPNFARRAAEESAPKSAKKAAAAAPAAKKAAKKTAPAVTPSAGVRKATPKKARATENVTETPF